MFFTYEREQDVLDWGKNEVIGDFDVMEVPDGGIRKSRRKDSCAYKDEIDFLRIGEVRDVIKPFLLRIPELNNWDVLIKESITILSRILRKVSPCQEGLDWEFKSIVHSLFN